MTENKEINIGLFGFGIVGEGLYHALEQRQNFNVKIKKICIKHSDKNRNAPESLFTTNKEEIFNDPSINVIVEVINDTKNAFEIVNRGLLSGRCVISASKKMIAENLQYLIDIQEKTGNTFLYESSACASIPIIRNLEEYYFNDSLQGLSGIVNGSTNFILSKILEEGLAFENALKLAQELGFAESDPSLDVEAYDALHKLIILLAHGFGLLLTPIDLLFYGIQNISLSDALYAQQQHYVIKLIAYAQRLSDGSIASFVLPSLIKEEHQFSFVQNEYNAVLIKSGLTDQQLFYGKGAGSLPTASAVLRDISALAHDYKYEYIKLNQAKTPQLAEDFYLKCYISFSPGTLLPFEELTHINTYHQAEDRHYITAIISYQYLRENTWWRNNGCSLLLLPDPIIEDDNFITHHFDFNQNLDRALN